MPEILLGKPRETLSYLERQQKVAEAQGLIYRLIELSLAEAQARKALGEDQQCFKLLERALNLGESTGCLRVFDQGPALTHLLKEAAHRGIARDYIEQIINTIGTSSGFEHRADASSLRQGRESWPGDIE